MMVEEKVCFLSSQHALKRAPGQSEDLERLRAQEKNKFFTLRLARDPEKMYSALVETRQEIDRIFEEL